MIYEPTTEQPIPEQPVTDQRSVRDLLSELVSEIQTLLRQEIALTKAEMSRKIKAYSKDVALLVAGATIGFVGFQALVATTIILLDLFLPLWLSALIVTALLLIGAYVLVRRGMDDMQQRSITPEQTVESLKEDKEWLQEEMS
jgi:uncharacterized membrane protein YqjE